MSSVTLHFFVSGFSHNDLFIIVNLENPRSAENLSVSCKHKI